MDLIPTLCAYPDCACPESAGLMSFTGHYEHLSSPEKKKVSVAGQQKRRMQLASLKVGFSSSNSHSIGTIASLLPRACGSGQGDFNYPVNLHTQRAHSKPLGTARLTIAETCLMLGFRLAVGTGMIAIFICVGVD